MKREENIRKRYKILFSLLLAALFISSCVHDPFPVLPDEGGPVIVNTDTLTFTINTKACNPDTVYFENEILPIYISNCAIGGCHDANTAKEGVVLTSYLQIRNKIKPFNPNDSEYFTVLITSDPGALMPRKPGTESGDPLSPDQIDLIRTWIMQGATNNYCDECDTTVYTFASAIQPIFENNCATSLSCHGSRSKNGELTTYDYIKQRVDVNIIQKRVLVNQDMPPSHPLPDCERLLIKLWIDNGALNN